MAKGKPFPMKKKMTTGKPAAKEMAAMEKEAPAFKKGGFVPFGKKKGKK